MLALVRISDDIAMYLVLTKSAHACKKRVETTYLSMSSLIGPAAHAGRLYQHNFYIA